MPDIALVNISVARSYNGKVLYERSTAGIFSLIAVLEESGYDVLFHEHSIDPAHSVREEIEILVNALEAVPIIGIGSHSIHLPFVVLAAEELKKRFPATRVVLGGMGPSGAAAELVEMFSFIDAVAVGEAEATILDIAARKGGQLQGIPGTVQKGDDGNAVTVSRRLIEDLDQLPLPAYNRINFRECPIPTIITSRGCPYGCSFCSLSCFWSHKVRYRSVDNVIRELRSLKDDFGIEYIFFGDPSFVNDRERALALCEGMQKSALGLKWECLVRADQMDPEIMREMNRSGCEAVFYGLESGSEQVLRRIKKGVTVARSLEVIRTSLDYFKTVEVGLMWGFPFETFDDFRLTLETRDRLEKEFGCEVQLRWLEPYPSTELYSQFREALFRPESTSLIYDPKGLKKKLVGGRNFYDSGNEMSGIRIMTDVTNVRFAVAAAHGAEYCRTLIEENPDIFTDYYKYRTPELERKLALAAAYSAY